MIIPRREHPKPQFMRDSWQNLNGKWFFSVDGGRSGVARGMNLLSGKGEYDKTITVPFSPESALSGVNIKDFMECVWYRRTFELDKVKGRTILHFGACDYKTTVWINEKEVGYHIGGYVSFSFDITEYVKEGENLIVVRAEDYQRSGTQPSGKQCYAYNSERCSYTRTTGIWQTVWLEFVPDAYVKSVRMTPNCKNSSLLIDAYCYNADGTTLSATATFKGKPVGIGSAVVCGRNAVIDLKLSKLRLWDFENPNLYDIVFTLGDDTVKSYFGMREVSYENGRFRLNGKSVFQRLVLDQGFYPDGIITAPSDKAMINDIKLAKSFGFNGARLHQKIFEERFLYHCDRLGYLVWGEHASRGLDTSKPTAWQGFIPEWTEEVNRDYNHPSIIGWCPLNESGKNQSRDFVHYLVDLTHSLDRTRPCIDASGWWHEGTSDIFDYHETERDYDALHKRYDPLMRGEDIDLPKSYPGKPVFISEMGAIWLIEPGGPEWCIREKMAADTDDLVRQIRTTCETFMFNDTIWGFCFTQFTDVEQEKNGICRYDRTPKVDPEKVRAVLSQKAAVED